MKNEKGKLLKELEKIIRNKEDLYRAINKEYPPEHFCWKEKDGKFYLNDDKT